MRPQLYEDDVFSAQTTHCPHLELTDTHTKCTSTRPCEKTKRTRWRGGRQGGGAAGLSEVLRGMQTYKENSLFPGCAGMNLRA